MNLDVTTLDMARMAWRAGGRAKSQVQHAEIDDLTLGATLEAACWSVSADATTQQLIAQWSDRNEPLAIALSALHAPTSPLDTPEDHAAPVFELRRCPSQLELIDPDVGLGWGYFLDRFRRAAARHLKIGPKRALMLRAALEEMADNVVQHAGLGTQPLALVAYSVRAPVFEIGVADLGRGVLASLHENIRHQHLATDESALRAACTENASRRAHSDGTGFANLLRALSDLDGEVSFRSGSARIILDGRGLGDRKIATRDSPILQGFQLSARGNPMASAWLT